MPWKLILLAAAFGGVVNSATAKTFQSQRAWQQHAEARAKELRAKNGNGTDGQLQKQLLAMFEEDQRARGVRGGTLDPPATLDDAALDILDATLTVQLKQIVANHGWPTIALVGAEASQAAGVMLIHSPDHTWQSQLLPDLQQLVDGDKIFGSDVATLTDSVLVLAGKPQRFGTRFEIRNREVVILPVDELQHLDERLERCLLPPMNVLRRILEATYKMPVRGPS